MSEVLLVEDSPVQREMISGILKDNGWKVTIACDGVEALEQLKTFNPDLVVLDIVMPRMNGYEVCRWIKSNPGTKNVPVVMCSSKGEDSIATGGCAKEPMPILLNLFNPLNWLVRLSNFYDPKPPA